FTLAELARLAGEDRRPPVERWNPAHCGDSFMRIASDGTWYHEGRPIAREGLVRLFSSILRREPDGSFVLVTPVEKLAIAVDDAPFVAVEMKSEGEGRERNLAFRINTGEVVIAGPEHELRLDGERPYLEIRRGLDAVLARPVYYELAEIGLDEGGAWSGGLFFRFGAAA
ncbi:MAG TPA: DUF1285 domain-containing protein, partial [Allosphingosinicella sp.]|nr:DUF1285 domain-containing protein [Allosphingosinicella sp.]